MPRATGGHMCMRSLAVAVGGALGLLACAPHEQGAPDTMPTRELSAQGWIDVTATLDPARTPVYAGDARLKFDFLKDMRKGDKLTLSVYSLGAHSGTHIDAPMHFVATGVPIDQVALDPLIGAARVIDIPDSVRAIDAGELNRHDWRGAKRVLFRTRSTLRGWMDAPEFHKAFAYIAPGPAQLLEFIGNRHQVVVVHCLYNAVPVVIHGHRIRGPENRPGNRCYRVTVSANVCSQENRFLR